MSHLSSRHLQIVLFDFPTFFATSSTCRVTLILLAASWYYSVKSVKISVLAGTWEEPGKSPGGGLIDSFNCYGMPFFATPRCTPSIRAGTWAQIENSTDKMGSGSLKDSKSKQSVFA